MAWIVVVEGEKCSLRFLGETSEKSSQVFFDGGGICDGFGCEKGLLVEEKGSWGYDSGCKNAESLPGDGLDLPWWGFYLVC